MNLLFHASWRAIAARGAVAVLFSLGAFLWPGVTLTALVVLFGAYALLDGVVALSIGPRTAWGWLLPLEGLLGTGFGLLALIWTAPTALFLTMTAGAWATMTGILELAVAVKLREQLAGSGLLALGGATSILLGILLFVCPALGAMALVLLLASYALVFGSAMLALAFRLRRNEKRSRGPGPLIMAS